MSRLRAISVLLSISVAVGALCPVPASAAPASPWLEIHSAHFTVVTDAGERKGKEVAFRFEQMRAVFASLLTKDRLNQPVPLTILAFQDDKLYYQAAPLRHGPSNQALPIDVPGFYLHGEDQDFILLNLSEEESWRAVAGDFARMLLNYNYPPAPAWFDDGLIEYFRSIRVDNQQVMLGADPTVSANASKSFTDLLRDQPWISITDVFSHKPPISTPDSPPTQYDAESWIVMHYLLHEQKMPQTGNYFALALNQHLPVEDAIQQAYSLTAEQFWKAVQEYFHSLSGQPTVVPTLIPFDEAAITAKPLPEDDARALYAAIQTRIPERRDIGLKALQSLATAPTPADVKSAAKAERKSEKSSGDDEKLLPTVAAGNQIAHRMLAWDHIMHGEFDDAIPELGDAAALNRSDMWVRYYLAVLKFRMAQAKHADIQGLPNMMLDLKSVLEWYPELADAYDLLAMARNEGGTAATAMQAERAAMSLSPRDERYAYHLALIYISSKKWDAAEAQLERLRTSSNLPLAEQARERLGEIGSQRKYGITGAASSQPKFQAQKSPFDVLEEDAAKRAQTEKSGQESGVPDKRQPKHVQGRLVSVDCSSAPVAVLNVSAEGKLLKLRASDYKSLQLIGTDDFSCDWQDRAITVNYRPGGTMDGDLMSLEVR